MAPSDDDPHVPTEVEIDAVLYEFKGNLREAVRALLHDLNVLAADYEENVSHGFVRRDWPWRRLA